MNKRKKLFCLVVVLFLSVFLDPAFGNAQTESEEQPVDSNASTQNADQVDSSVFLLLDGSGSMQEVLQEKKKIDLLKSSLNDSLTTAGENVAISVWGFGNTVTSQQRQESCEDVSELFPVAENSEAKVTDVINQFAPLGNSPISFSLSSMLPDIKAVAAVRPVSLVMILDGADNCGGSPEDQLAELEAIENVSISIVAVGAAQDADAIRSYANAAGADLFTIVQDDVFSTTISQALRSVRGASAEGTIEISGGKSFEEARIFTDDLFGKNLSIDSHLKENQFSYFKMSLEPGQGAQIEVRTGDKDVQFAGDDAQVTEDEPSAGLTVFGFDEEKVFDVSIQQQKNAKKNGTIYSVSSDARRHEFYLAVGYTLPVHQDMIFKVDLINQYDEAVGKTDAPDSINGRLVVVTKGDYTGYLSQNDEADFYSVDLQVAQKLSVEIEPEGVSDFGIEIYDVGGTQLISRRGEKAGDTVVAEITASERGRYAFAVRQGIGKYRMKINIVTEEVANDRSVNTAIDATGEGLVDPNSVNDGQMNSTTIVALIIIGFILFVVVLVVSLVVVRFRKSTSKNKLELPKKIQKISLDKKDETDF